jgi:hypothetical protein
VIADADGKNFVKLKKKNMENKSFIVERKT